MAFIHVLILNSFAHFDIDIFIFELDLVVSNQTNQFENVVFTDLKIIFSHGSKGDKVCLSVIQNPRHSVQGKEVA